MRRVIGPIVTTAASLAVAAVVVANPVIAPHPDIQIPAIALSAGSDVSVGMLDQSFLDAIAPRPESNNPLSLLKQLFTSLAADVSDRGTSAIVDAFVAGVSAVSGPELTAASSPLVAAPAGSPPTVAPWPGSAGRVGCAATELATAGVSDMLTPTVQYVVGSVVSDVGYVGSSVVAAAFAAGALVGSEPALIGDPLRSLVNGDINGALQNAVRVIVTPLGPPLIIINALRTVIEGHLVRLADLSQTLVPDPAGASSDSAAPSIVEALAPRVATPPARSVRPGRADARATSLPAPAAAREQPALGSPALARSSSNAADVAGGGSPAPRRTGAAVRDAVSAISDQIDSGIDAVERGVGDAAHATAGRRVTARTGSEAR